MEEEFPGSAREMAIRNFVSDPIAALFAMVFLLLPIAHLPILGVPLYLGETAVLLTAAALLRGMGWRSATRRFREITTEDRVFFAGTLLFFAGVVLSYVINPHTLFGLGKIKSFYLIPVFLSFLIVFWVRTRERLEWLFGAWLLGLVTAAGAGVVAASCGWFLYDGRLAGPYQSANYLALLLAPGVPLSIYFLVSYRCIPIRTLSVLAGALIISALFLTRSYGVWLGVIMAFCSLVWLYRRAIWSRSRRCLLVLGLTLCLVGAGIFQEMGSEKWQSLISGDDRSSLASRLMIWQAAGRMADESFPWGIGPGRFQAVYLSYQPLYPPYLEWAVPTPHNLYLTFLLEGGVLTLLGFLGPVAYIFWCYQKAAAGTGTLGEGRNFRAFSSAILILYLVSGLVDTPYMKNDLALAVWSCLGFCVAAARIRVNGPTEHARPTA